MCMEASLVVSPQAVYWSPETDSHTEIRNTHNLGSNRQDPNLVDVEIHPPGEDYTAPIESWTLKTDQPENMLPGWWLRTPQMPRIQTALKEWLKARNIVTRAAPVTPKVGCTVC